MYSWYASRARKDGDEEGRYYWGSHNLRAGETNSMQDWPFIPPRTMLIPKVTTSTQVLPNRPTDRPTYHDGLLDSLFNCTQQLRRQSLGKRTSETGSQLPSDHFACAWQTHLKGLPIANPCRACPRGEVGGLSSIQDMQPQ